MLADAVWCLATRNKVVMVGKKVCCLAAVSDLPDQMWRLVDPLQLEAQAGQQAGGYARSLSCQMVLFV